MLSWTGTPVTSSFTLKRLHNNIVKFIMFNQQIVKKPAKKKKLHQKFEPSITKDTLKCREKKGHEAKQNQGFYFFSSNT
jgi:hypothetical protein